MNHPNKPSSQSPSIKVHASSIITLLCILIFFSLFFGCCSLMNTPSQKMGWLAVTHKQSQQWQRDFWTRQPHNPPHTPPHKAGTTHTPTHNKHTQKNTNTNTNTNHTQTQSAPISPTSFIFSPKKQTYHHHKQIKKTQPTRTQTHSHG